MTAKEIRLKHPSLIIPRGKELAFEQWFQSIPKDLPVNVALMLPEGVHIKQPRKTKHGTEGE